MTRFPIAVASLLCLLLQLPARADELAVLEPETDGGPPRRMLTRYLKRQAHEALERRRAALEALKTPGELGAYRERTREVLLEKLGGFPERSPLNARVVGKIRRDGYRVEKLIYESQPRHFVTAALYLPDGEGPHPAVLVPCGHSRDGKISNQRPCILLARHGIAALCYDPIGQGERYQLLDAGGTPRFKSTTEHTLVGASCILLGRNTATYRVWDGMRSIDYLASRDDIDASRIGVTGCSGGGTLTSYLMALDDRVACAAPSCYITSFRRLIDTIGPQDAEQNIHGQLAAGIDHADYLMMRAPRPTMILASTRDFFDIDGTWDAFRQAKRFYGRLGFPERIGLVEVDAEHGYPRPQREAMLRWMRRWLQGIDEPATEPDIEPLPASELLCTPAGQTLRLEGARSVADLNVELNETLGRRRREIWADRERALAEVRRVAGVRELADLVEPGIEKAGTIERDGYRIEKLVLRPEPGILLPALLFRPQAPSGRRVLYLRGEGKDVDAAAGGAIEKLVRTGALVLAVDLRGIGETGADGDNLWGGDWDDFFLAYLVGRSLVGMRAEDALVAARFLSRLESDTPAAVDLVGSGVAGPPALHAAALERHIFGEVKVVRSLRSWSDVVRDPAAGGHLVNVVHGALRVYDLLDLFRSLDDDVGRARSGRVLIVEDGVPKLPILVRSAREPAAELERYLERISGANLEIAVAEPGGTGIYVGTAAEFPWVDLGDTSDLGPEGFLIRSDGASVALIGHELLGVQHAVTTFLHGLGCRWFFPGPVWEVIPRRKTIAGSWDERQTPSFPTQRRIWYGYGAYPRGREELAEWNRHNRMGGPIEVSIGHTWAGLDLESDFAAHPEWFALVDGQRRPTKPCYSQPAVLERAIESARRQASRGVRMISMTPPDGLGYCECERCLEVFRGGEPFEAHRTLFARRPDGVVVNVTSETLFTLVNRVAEAVAADHPDALIGCYAYSAYSHPPSFDLHPNVYLQTTTAFRRTPLSLEEQIEEFGKRTRQVGVREYYSAYQWDWDYPDPGKVAPGRLQEDLRFYRRKGVTAVNAEASNNWAPRGLGYYVASRLLWDVEADVEAIVRDFYEGAFGPAAEPMERYYVRWYGPDAAALEGARDLPEKRVLHSEGALDAGALRAACDDLDEAARIVRDLPPYRDRVDHLRMYLCYLFLRVRLQEAERNGDAERIARAIRDETVFGGRLTDTNTVHGRALIGKAFLRRFREFSALLEEVPEAREPGRGWRVVGQPPPREELERLWTEAMAELRR